MKKVMAIFFMIFAFFIISENVSAKKISVSDVVEKAYEHHYNPLVLDETNHVIKYIDEEDGELFSISYTDDYIEYQPIVNEAYMESIKYVSDAGTCEKIIEGVIKSSGHEGIIIKGRDKPNYDDKFINTYDEYGILYNSKHYDNDSSPYDNNLYMEHFKISLDTEKIDKFVNKFGFTQLDYSNTKIIANKITTNSISVAPLLLNDYYKDEMSNVDCSVYRSEKEDGEYALIATKKCDGKNLFVDSNLKENTTYYYKSRVEDGEKLSGPFKITTKDSRTPSIKTSDVTDGSVKLTPKVKDGDKTYCYIYRSKNKKDGFKKINNDSILCDGSKTIKDNGLKSNTTYYYKAILENGMDFGDVVDITTDEGDKEETLVDENGNPVLKNPNTGSFIPVILFSVLIIISIAVIKYTRRKNLFKNI